MVIWHSDLVGPDEWAATVQRRRCDLNVRDSKASSGTECLQRPLMPKLEALMMLWSSLDESIHNCFFFITLLRLMIDRNPQICLSVRTDLNTHTHPLNLPQRTWAISWRSRRLVWLQESWSWWTRWRLPGPPYLPRRWAPPDPGRYHPTRDKTSYVWVNLSD